LPIHNINKKQQAFGQVSIPFSLSVAKIHSSGFPFLFPGLNLFSKEIKLQGAWWTVLARILAIKLVALHKKLVGRFAAKGWLNL
jgi:hypothetical protein